MEFEGLKEVVERIVMLPVRVRHRAKARRKRYVRTQAIASVRRTLSGAKGLKAQSIHAVFNVGLYLLLLDQDLADFTDDMVCAVGERRRRFVAKHEAILLYEAAEDLPQLLGRDLREAIAALGANEDQQRRLNGASTGLNQFWREDREFLGDIRKALAAHREHDALAYVEKLDGLRPLEVMRLAAELSGHLERLIAVLTDLAGLTVGMPAVINDMRRSSKRRTPRSSPAP